MKNLFAVASVFALLPCMGFASNDVPRYSYARDMYGDLNVGYGAETVVSNRQYYVGGRGELSFLNWDNEYQGTIQGSDSFSFEPVLGLNFFVGYKFSDIVRADMEIGYIGEFKKSETKYQAGYVPEKKTFEFETYYMTLNGYYNLKYGLYAGLGIGGAITNVSLDYTGYARRTEKNVSLLVAGMFGWSYVLDEKTEFDLRYRLSVFDGGDINFGGMTTDIGYVMDNSFSAGVRCYF